MDAAATAARDGQTALALRLAKHLAPPPPCADNAASAANATTNNVAFSPASVHAALALAAAGARGATLAQLLAFLGAPSAEALAGFGRDVVARRVLADRSGDGGGPRVLFGGGVWVDAARGGLADAFRCVAAESYKSEARTVSFAKVPEAAVKMINEWVKKATNGLIDTVISYVDAATDLVLANAVYFNGAWQEPFDPYGTRRSTFHRLDGIAVAGAEFMTNRARLDVACMDGFKVLKLPYKAARGQLKRRRGPSSSGAVKSKAKASPPPEVDEGTQYSMFVFLPDARDGLSTMVDVVTASPAFMYGILAEMKRKPVSVKLPKFEISFSWGDLKPDLCRLGLSLPFSPEAADLRGMYKGDHDTAGGGARRPTFLAEATHMAVVKVDELGTEAAAAMMCRTGGGGPPPDLIEFTADHPFTFFIIEELSGVIVFAGHVFDLEVRMD
ncbi:unnamed protein product [Urochloa humidicola]